MTGPASMSIDQLEVDVGAQLAALERPLEHLRIAAPPRLDEVLVEDPCSSASPAASASSRGSSTAACVV